ncbi:LysR family transcriptional regulator [Amycolatopsis pithecellobii]|uniref:LysR family transcriptional regulator n=1 Tax=Amycolatopsis pithecellobii TaxID=664692 RepID=A0A6N7Z4J9_9PSEU|nr:LysR family transcriptional regulator [Amycolatopsis pithecellobii]MTD55240.1 LysR family transcriptional regulator [Amycolatopsis pithecellobii]
MQLDLNLLTALDALLEEGSVAGAADRLHLTAPAMSRALGRIRRATGDQILVRTGRTMTPTPHALAIRGKVHALVQQAHAVLTPDRELDLATLDRTFTLRWHDAVTTAVGPTVLATVQEQAPGVRLRLLAEADADTNDLRHGQVDLELGADDPLIPDVHAETAADDRLVVAIRPEHPLAKRKLTLARYAGADHLTVSRRGRLRDPIDDVLHEHGTARRVVAAVPTLTAALHFVQQNDILVTVPENTSRALLTETGLEIRPVPLELPPVPLILAWHRRYDTDPAHAWLRDLVRTALRELSPGAKR